MKETRKIEFGFEIFRIIVALAIAYGITLLCIMIISDDPFQAVYMFAVGPFTSIRRLGQLFGKFIPYLLTGLTDQHPRTAIAATKNHDTNYLDFYHMLLDD